MGKVTKKMLWFMFPALLGLIPCASDAAMDPPPLKKNRVMAYPLTSFVIGGLNGVYERRMAGGRRGFCVPFYLGKQSSPHGSSSTSMGLGAGISRFFSSMPWGGHLSLTVELLDVYDENTDVEWMEADPSFPESTIDEVTRTHNWTAGLTFLYTYRWEYANGFLADLGGGFAYLYFSTEEQNFLSELGDYSGFYPMINFSIGYAF